WDDNRRTFGGASMKFALRITIAALAALAVSATASAQQKNTRAPGFSKLAPGAKLVIMPADIEMFEVSGGGVFEPRAGWTEAAQKQGRTAYQGRRDKLGLQVVDLENDDSEAVLELNRLQRAVGGAIASHHFGMMALPTKEEKLDWSLGPSVNEVREKT